MNEVQGLRLPGRQATPSPGRFSRKDGLEHGLACFVEKYRPTYQPNRDLGSCSFSESIAWSRRAGAVYGARMSTPGSEPRRRRRVASHIFPARRGLCSDGLAAFETLDPAPKASLLALSYNHPPAPGVIRAGRPRRALSFQETRDLHLTPARSRSGGRLFCGQVPGSSDRAASRLASVKGFRRKGVPS
jgi:hypothetical protein